MVLSLSQGGAITLTNPKIGVNGLCSAGISFELGGDLEELNREFLYWFPYNRPFNTLLTTEMEGRNCSLSVTYIVFSKAILANLEIMLLGGEEEEKKKEKKEKINGDDEEEEKEEEDDEEKEGNATICGEITASFSEWPGLAFTLFDKKSNECVSVSGKGLIPLYKSVIAVPFASDFDIKVNLLVAAGQVRFIPRCFGDYVGTISDQIRVKVTFWDWRYHPETLIAENNFKVYNDRSDEEEEEEEEEEVEVEEEKEEEEEEDEEDEEETGSNSSDEIDYYSYLL